MTKSNQEFKDFVHVLSSDQLDMFRLMPAAARLQWLEEANAFINKALGFQKRARFDERFKYLASKRT